MIIFTFVLLLDTTRSFETGLYSFGQPISTEASDRTHDSMTTCAVYRLSIAYLTRAKNISNLESSFHLHTGHCQDLHILISDQLTKLNFSRWSHQFARREIAAANIMTDVRYLFVPYAHFDDEQFEEGSKFVMLQLRAAQTSLKHEEWSQARLAIGTLLHSLQDFYSHTNWIELGMGQPNQDLATGRSLGSMMNKTTRACRSCSKMDKKCIANNLILHQELTSGYFSFVSPSAKPPGKCSHGGMWDYSLDDDAVGGGINKDSSKADHGHLHIQAASVAYLASVKVLNELWASTNDDGFEKMLGLSNSFSLVFAIDISHRLDSFLHTIQIVMNSLEQSIEHMPIKPSNFIISPFNSSHWGPIRRVTKFNTFMGLIEKLNESDLQYSSEYYYQPLNAALRLCESNSFVFLLTDAPSHPMYSYGRTRVLAHFKEIRIDVLLLNSSQSNSETMNTLKQLTSITGGLFIPITINHSNTMREFLLNRLRETVGYECILFEPSVTRHQGTFFVDQTSLFLQIKVIASSSGFSVDFINPTGVVFVLTSSFIGDYLQVFTVDVTDRSLIGQWIYNCSENCAVEINIQSHFRCQTHLYAPRFDDDFALLVTPPLVNQYDVFAIITCDHSTEIRNSSIALIDVKGNMLSNSSIPNPSLTKWIVVPSESFRIRTRIEHRDGSVIYRDERIRIDSSQFLLIIHHQPLILNNNQTLNISFSIRNYSPISLRVHLNMDGLLPIFQSYSINPNSTRDGQITIHTNQYQSMNETRIILLVFALQAFPDQLDLASFQHEQIVPLYLQRAEINLGRPTHFLNTSSNLVNEGSFPSVTFLLVIFTALLISGN